MVNWTYSFLLPRFFVAFCLVNFQYFSWFSAVWLTAEWLVFFARQLLTYPLGGLLLLQLPMLCMLFVLLLSVVVAPKPQHYSVRRFISSVIWKMSVKYFQLIRMRKNCEKKLDILSNLFDGYLITQLCGNSMGRIWWICLYICIYYIKMLDYLDTWLLKWKSLSAISMGPDEFFKNQNT